MNRPARIAIRSAIAVAILLVALSIAALVIFRSAWFHEQVRRRVISEIEKSTGGRVELGNFDFDSQRLSVTLGPLVLHGKESSAEPPLLTVPSMTFGLRIVSMLERKVDLKSLRLDQPAVHVVFYPDGSTNLPSPGTHGSANWAENIINIGIGHYDIDGGLLDLDHRAIPFNLHGDNLRLRMDLNPISQAYRGEFASRRFRVTRPGLDALDLDIDSVFTFDKSRIEIARLRVSMGGAQAELNGVLDDVRSPHGTLRIQLATSIREALKRFPLPIGQTGTAKFDGQLAIAFSDPRNFTMTGRVDAQGISYTRQRVKIDNAALQANASVTAQEVSLDQVTIAARGVKAMGAASLNNWCDFHFVGNFSGLTIAQAAGFVTDRPLPWNGSLTGSLKADAAIGDTKGALAASIAITPLAGAPPVQGSANLTYSQASGRLLIADANLITAATRVEASGSPGETINIQAQTTNLDDLLPALALVDAHAPKQLPVKLIRGRAEFSGALRGKLDGPLVSGHIELLNLAIDDHPLDRFSADIEGIVQNLHLTNLVAVRGATIVNGTAAYSDPNLTAALTIRNAQLNELAKEFKIDQPVSGAANATIAFSGTREAPQAAIEAQIENVSAFGEHFDHIAASLHYSNDSIEIHSGEADGYAGKAQFKGSVSHRGGDFENAAIQFDVAASGIQLGQIPRVLQELPGFAARVDANAKGAAHLTNRVLALDFIDGSANLHSIVWDKRSFGDVAVEAETHAGNLGLHATEKLGDLTATAQGSWRLAGDEPGSATVDFSRASIATLHSLVLAGAPSDESAVPFEGFMDGAHASVTLSLLKPKDFRAVLTIHQLEVNAKASQTLRLGVQPQDLIVKNSKPVEIDVTWQEARIRSAEFGARDTNLSITGAVPFHTSNAGLAINGSVNLLILQLLNPDLTARGQAIVQASVRGSLNDPQLNGRMELKNASLYLGDLPNGIDNANGSILFDRNRATIEKLKAETGGGVINFTGFIGFGSTLVYRLQAVAQKVRVRYPEDASVTFNGTLALNGSSEASTVSGVVTLGRASFTPRADFAQVLAQAAHPASAPVAASEYVRGMQFDVRIESDPNFEFQTSLTRNLEAEVDLRLRGTPLRPVLLGSVSVNDGEVQIFGNHYTVNRGDIRFINPLKVDPIFDMDLETKARGVTVNITISGTTQKLNVNYSSDPPMQPRDIIALLAVGRTPTETAGLNAAPSSADSANLSEAGGSLISQAISAQLSSRLQRFFGASRVKIDPALNGVEYLPEARLTIEQQVSKDITLTYITNLNRTQEQIVQIEWDFNKQWSAVATREASGLFGIDFQYRKRFK